MYIYIHTYIYKYIYKDKYIYIYILYNTYTEGDTFFVLCMIFYRRNMVFSLVVSQCLNYVRHKCS